MKGVVFTEFTEMVEDKFSPEILEKIIDQANLPSEGIYTSVGTYDHDEIIALVQALSNETNISIPDLIKTFGNHLFGQFEVGYPQFFEGVDSAITFLSKIDNYIHVEVRKLYPDAELPKFEYEVVEDDQLIMEYRSIRPFADLAEGLIQGCIEHFGGGLVLKREDIGEKNGTNARFTINRIE